MTPSQISDTRHWLAKIAAYELGSPEVVAECRERGIGFGFKFDPDVTLGGAEHRAIVRLHNSGLIESQQHRWFHNPANRITTLGIYEYRLTDAGREFLAIYEDTPSNDYKRPKRAFITHGTKRDYIANVTEVCQQLNIDPVVAIDSPNMSRTVEEKVKQEMEACDIYIVLLTSDNGNAPSPNAIGELHHAVFSYPDRVIILRERGVEMPSNLSGRATGWLEGQWKYDLMRELQALIAAITQESPR